MFTVSIFKMPEYLKVGVLWIGILAGADACASTTMDVAVSPDTPCSPIVLKRNSGKFDPLLVNSGPQIINEGEKPVPLCRFETKVKSSSATGAASGLIKYSTEYNKRNVEWSVGYNISASSVSVSYIIDGIQYGVAVTLATNGPEWKKRIVPTRLAENYPGGNKPNIFYNDVLGKWFYGVWDFDLTNACGSAGTTYGLDLNSDGSTSTLPVSILTACKTGNSELRGTYVISIGKDVWSTIPQLSNEVSPFRDELRSYVYFDIWSGNFNAARSMLDWAKEFSGGLLKNLTIAQVWQYGGFDNNHPMSIWPGKEIGSHYGNVDELMELGKASQSWGMFGLRTNYVRYAGNLQPSSVVQLRDKNSKPRDMTNLASIGPVVEEQEKYLHKRFGYKATFSDQLASGGDGFAYIDIFDEGQSISDVRQYIRNTSDSIKKITGGPLFSETLNAEYLMGRVDSGDYGIFAGHERSLNPVYKLMRLHRLGTYYGMGLGYRFFLAPPYSGGRQGEGTRMYKELYSPASDDYRAATILYGNGAYIFFDLPLIKGKVLSELMTVGMAQKYYLGEEVSSVEFDVNGRWVNFDWLLMNEDHPEKFYDYIKVKYKNGLNVFVNRGDRSQQVNVPGIGSVELPKYSYAVFKNDGAFVGFSGIVDYNGKKCSVDYTLDRAISLEFIDPRGGQCKGYDTPVIIRNGKLIEVKDWKDVWP